MLKDSTDPPALAGNFPPSGNLNTLRKHTIIAPSPQPRHIALCSYYFRPELFSDHCFAWHVLAAASFAAHSGDYAISMLDAVLALTHTAFLQLSMPCHAIPRHALSSLLCLPAKKPSQDSQTMDNQDQDSRFTTVFQFYPILFNFCNLLFLILNLLCRVARPKL